MHVHNLTLGIKIIYKIKVYLFISFILDMQLKMINKAKQNSTLYPRQQEENKNLSMFEKVDQEVEKRRIWTD